MLENSLSDLLKLRRAMLGLELELGLKKLTQDEKDLLVSIDEMAEPDGSFRSDNLKRSELIASMPSASFHRALHHLIEKDFIKKNEDFGRAHYFLLGFQPSEITK